MSGGKKEFGLTWNLNLISRWQSQRTCVHILLRELQNCKSLLNNHLKNVGSHWKKIPIIQGQGRSPNKTVEGVKLHLESNPIPTRDAWRAQTKPWVHQSPETPQKTEWDLPLSVRESLWEHRSAAACHGDRGRGFGRHGSMACGINPLGGVRH